MAYVHPKTHATPLPEDQFFRLLAETIPHMVWTARADGANDYQNRRLYEYTGLDAAQLEGWGWKAMVHPEDWPRCLEAWTRALQTGERYDVEYRLRRADGAYRWHHGTALPLRDPEGRIARWFGTCTDIEHEIRSAQMLESMVEERTRALQESEEKARRYADEIRSLMDRLVAAQESERRRIAGELHDLIGQNLTAIGIELGAVGAQLAEPGRAAVGARLEAMAALLEATIGAIRGVMTNLRPPALEEFGLVPALRGYAAEFGQRTGMRVSIAAAGRERRLPRDAELALFRIVQEALTNAAKHSGGSSVAISVSENAGRMRVAVEDDGLGFATPAGARSARRGGWGLPAMRERAEAHGGSLRIEFPERGSRLVVELPGVIPD